MSEPEMSKQVVMEEVLLGREIGAPFTAKVDVVIIGSGAGGAVAARELSRDGRSVIVLEEGGYYTPEEYGAMTPSHSLRRLAREAGLMTAVGLGDTPVISVMAGKCVGGSSVLTGGVCFRIPDEILHDWVKDLGLTGMSPEALAPHFEEVERTCHIDEVPEYMRSRSTELFVEGAAKMGVTMKPTRRNTVGCKGAARCNFGCPNHAKLSVDVSFLPDARTHGTRVIADALVEKIDVAGGRARGVRGRFLDATTGEPRVPFEIQAKAVVVACGSVHTPALMRKSGLGSKHVGHHLTLHPAFRVSAIFDEEVNGWDGALQSVYSDHYAHDGITLVGVYTAVNVIGATFPGAGQKHRDYARKIPNMALFGGMIHDDGGGTIMRSVGREPLVLYRMAEKDRPRLFRGIQILAQMAFAAGAKEVILPIFGGTTIKSVAEADALTARPPAARRVECMAFHPLGSAKMSNDERYGVVKPSGETWMVDNLYVADGSVLPTSIGVNSQVPVMSVAHKIARGMCDDWSRIARRAM